MASMGLRTILLIVSIGLHATDGSAQDVTTATSEFAPQSVDELKDAVDKCLSVNENNSSHGSFTFVMIPARSEDPIQEIVRSKAGGLEHDELKEYMMAHYNFFEGGRLLITGLDVPRLENNFTYVSCYSDSFAQGQSKDVNKRATTLLSATRHTETIVYGDAFLSRSFGNSANKSLWERKDFFAKDVDETARWVRDAKLNNHKIADQLVNVEGLNAESKWKEMDQQGPVTWWQGEEEVEVYIQLPEGAKARDVLLTIKPSSIKFALKNGFTTDNKNVANANPILRRIVKGLSLFRKIDPDESTWSVSDDNKLYISLAKKEPVMWSNLYTT